MNQLPDERFSRLAKLVGHILADRWMRSLGHRSGTQKGPQAKSDRRRRRTKPDRRSDEPQP
jgi:hypothetical protein